MEDVVAVIGIFGAIPFIIWVVLYFRYKAKAKSAEIIKSMLDKDTSVTPELIKSVGFTPRRSHNDLRSGMLWVAIGLATVLFGGAIPEEDAAQVFAGIAMFPMLIGVALLIFWFAISRKDQD